MVFILLHIEEERPHVSLSSLLRYITGSSSIPPLGFSSLIRITYQINDEDAIYPTAQACFSRLSLPVVHKSQHSFNAAFIKALEYGGGYGNI